MLLALTRPSRSEDLASLQIDRSWFSPEGAAFLPATLAKQSWQGKALTEYFSHPSLTTENCVQWPLSDGILMSLSHRVRREQKLFVAIVNPNYPVSSSTIAQWLRDTLQQAEIDVGIFGPHSM